MAGILDGVLPKYFNSFGFIKSITPETRYLLFFFYYKESLSFHYSGTDLRGNWSVTEGGGRADVLLWTTQNVFVVLQNAK